MSQRKGSGSTKLEVFCKTFGPLGHVLDQLNGPKIETKVVKIKNLGKIILIR